MVAGQVFQCALHAALRIESGKTSIPVLEVEFASLYRAACDRLSRAMAFVRLPCGTAIRHGTSLNSGLLRPLKIVVRSAKEKEPIAMRLCPSRRFAQLSALEIASE